MVFNNHDLEQLVDLVEGNSLVRMLALQLLEQRRASGGVDELDALRRLAGEAHHRIQRVEAREAALRRELEASLRTREVALEALNAAELKLERLERRLESLAQVVDGVRSASGGPLRERRARRQPRSRAHPERGPAKQNGAP